MHNDRDGVMFGGLDDGVYPPIRFDGAVCWIGLIILWDAFCKMMMCRLSVYSSVLRVPTSLWMNLKEIRAVDC